MTMLAVERRRGDPGGPRGVRARAGRGSHHRARVTGGSPDRSCPTARSRARCITDEVKLAARSWEQIDLMHRRRHRPPPARWPPRPSWRGPQVDLDRFRWAVPAATDDLLAIDVADFLTATSALVGVERAVGVAIGTVGSDPVIDAASVPPAAGPGIGEQEGGPDRQGAAGRDPRAGHRARPVPTTSRWPSSSASASSRSSGSSASAC